MPVFLLSVVLGCGSKGMCTFFFYPVSFRDKIVILLHHTFWNSNIFERTNVAFDATLFDCTAKSFSISLSSASSSSSSASSSSSWIMGTKWSGSTFFIQFSQLTWWLTPVQFLFCRYVKCQTRGSGYHRFDHLDHFQGDAWFLFDIAWFCTNCPTGWVLPTLGTCSVGLCHSNLGWLSDCVSISDLRMCILNMLWV